jgi:hypothetical protein
LRPTDPLAAGRDRDKLGILLVHGPFGDGSHWRHIIPGLHRVGHRVMAAQNPLTESLVLATTHRPLARRCFRDPTGEPAWRIKPTWYQVSTPGPHAPAGEPGWMAERMHARETIERVPATPPSPPGHARYSS